jgi:hypothetical protein
MNSKKYILVLFVLIFTLTVNAQFLVKLMPSSPIISGEIGLAYEQSFRPKLSIEVQAGATFSKQLIPIKMGAIGNYYSDAERKNDWGYFGAVSLRHYFYKYQMAPAGFYVGTLYKYRLYNIQFVDQNYGLGTKRGRDSQFLLQALIGYQYPATDFLSFDFYIGLGVNFRNVKSYQNNFSVDAVSGTEIYYWEEIRKKPIVFAPTVGVKIGFGKSGKEWLN